MSAWKRETAFLLVLGASACSSTQDPGGVDIVRDTFPEAQAAIEAANRAVFDAIHDSDWEVLRSYHLASPKFTKFGRGNARLGFEETIASETADGSALLAAIPDAAFELQDRKVDVFGDTAVETAYLVVTGTLPDGSDLKTRGRITGVWVQTPDGWKIAHEHNTAANDIVRDAFPADQLAIRGALQALAEIGRKRDWEALRAAHLEGPKFTEFADGRQRNDFDAMLAREVAGLSTLEDFSIDWRDLKIDVFGDVAVATAFPLYTGTGADGEKIEIERRATMIYVKTPDGWKIAHEHLSKAETE